MLNRRNKPNRLEDKSSAMIAPRALPSEEVDEKANRWNPRQGDRAGAELSIKTSYALDLKTGSVIPHLKAVPTANNPYPVMSDAPPADNKHQGSMTQEPRECFEKNKNVRRRRDLSANRPRLESRSKQRNESITDDSNKSRHDRTTMIRVELRMIDGRLTGVRINSQAIEKDVLIYEDAGVHPLPTTTDASTTSPAISHNINAIPTPQIANLLLPRMAQLNHPASYACPYCQDEGNPMDCMEKHEELQESMTRQHECLNPYTGIRANIINIPADWQPAQLSTDGSVLPVLLFPTVIDGLEAFFVHLLEPPPVIRQTISRLSPLAAVFRPTTARPAPNNQATTETNPSNMNTTWESPAAKARRQYQHFERQSRHLGAQEAPGLPQTAGEYIAVKQASLSDRISFIERQKSATTTMKELRQAFGGRDIGAGDGRSTVLSQESLAYTQRQARDKNSWPKYLSYKSVGDEAARAGQPRTLPGPNTSYEFDRVWENPVSAREGKTTEEEEEGEEEAIGSELMKEISKSV